MKIRRRGRPSKGKKHQMNIRVGDEYKSLFSDDTEKGPLWHFLRAKSPARWYQFDPPENPDKKWHDDYSKKSKRSSQTWSNSSIIMSLVHDFMNFGISKFPKWFIQQHEDYKFSLPMRYLNLAKTRYVEVHSDCDKDE